VEQTSPEKRTYSLARLSSLQYAGFSMTPIVGSTLVYSGFKISDDWGYALPAYLIALEGILCIVLLLFTFQDINESHMNESHMNESHMNTQMATNQQIDITNSTGSHNYSLILAQDSIVDHDGYNSTHNAETPLLIADESSNTNLNNSNNDNQKQIYY
jgi:hypothetical protein